MRRRSPFASQSESVALHAPAALEELVEFRLLWLILCLSSLPRVDKNRYIVLGSFLVWLSSQLTMSSLTLYQDLLVCVKLSPNIFIRYPRFSSLPSLVSLHRLSIYLSCSASLGKI
jgi:hypothetical protein